MPSSNVLNELCAKITLLRLKKKTLTELCNAVYFRLNVDLIHVTPQVKTEEYDSSHHPSYAECGRVTREKCQDSEKFRPMSACTECAGCHEPILFANVLNPIFTERGSYFSQIRSRCSNLWLLVSFLCAKGLVYVMIRSVVEQIRFHRHVIM